MFQYHCCGVLKCYFVIYKYMYIYISVDIHRKISADSDEALCVMTALYSAIAGQLCCIFKCWQLDIITQIFCLFHCLFR